MGLQKQASLSWQQELTLHPRSWSRSYPCTICSGEGGAEGLPGGTVPSRHRGWRAGTFCTVGSPECQLLSIWFEPRAHKQEKDISQHKSGVRGCPGRGSWVTGTGVSDAFCNQLQE